VAILSDGHQRTIRNLDWSHDSQTLASCSFDASTCIWRRCPDTSDWSCVISLEGHESEVKAVEFSHDDRLMATCGRDKSVWIWERLGNSESDDEYECVAVLTDHSQDVKCVRWHPSERLLASCSYDDTIRIYTESGDDWSCIDVLKGHTSTVWSVDFNAAGDRLVSCSDDQSIRIWGRQQSNNQPGDWKCLCTLRDHHKKAIYDVSWSKLDNQIASAGRDNALCIYIPSELDSDIFELSAKSAVAHRMDVNSVKWNPVITNQLVTGGDDRLVSLWKYDRYLNEMDDTPDEY
jgi:WD40 repeat protein